MNLLGITSSTSTSAYAVWGVLAGLGLALLVSALRRSVPVARPAEVLTRMATHPVLRLLLVLGYMWLGWHLFAR